MLLRNKRSSLVKVTHRRGHVTTFGAETKYRAVLLRFPTSTRGFSLVENLQIGF
jgi:hypothetical protein